MKARKIWLSAGVIQALLNQSAQFSAGNAELDEPADRELLVAAEPRAS
jgi:hypothetical protein